MNNIFLKIFLLLITSFYILSANDSKDKKNLLQETYIESFSMADLIKSQEAKKILYPHVQIEFISTVKPKKTKKSKVKIQELKKDVVSSKITNIFLKDSKEVCSNIFLYALKSLQETAIKEGGSKIINVSSYFDSEVYNDKKFQCKINFAFARVVLKGDIIK